MTTNEENLRRLLRRAICDFIEPVGISHVSKDTEWRVEADAFIKECAPLVFGKDETVFGLKRANVGHNPGPYVSDERVREIIGDSSIEPEKRMLAQHTIDGRAANGLLELYCDERDAEVAEMRAAEQIEGKKTHEEIEVACKNIGYDLSCGACAERFFTGGSWGTEHEETCATLAALKSTSRAVIMSVQ